MLVRKKIGIKNILVEEQFGLIFFFLVENKILSKKSFGDILLGVNNFLAEKSLSKQIFWPNTNLVLKK